MQADLRSLWATRQLLQFGNASLQRLILGPKWGLSAVFFLFLFFNILSAL